MIIAAICVYAWGSCYFRARGLQSAVQSYHGKHIAVLHTNTIERSYRFTL